MGQSLLQSTITAFVMLIVLINPIAVAQIFVGASGMGAGKRVMPCARWLKPFVGLPVYPAISQARSADFTT